jgi:ABC-type glutathione transport system ATPase component
MADEPVLSVAGLRVEYPDADGRWIPVVDGLSIEVGAGDRVGLVGRSGSGKSAAALATLGLTLPPGRITGGRVVVSGVDLAAASSEELCRVRGGEIGLVFQEVSAALNPVLSIGAQIAETVRAHREATRLEARAVARQLLEDLDVDDPAQTLAAAPHQLSGGQLQRVMMAIALAGQPKLLIADEPTTALDLATRSRILELLGRLTADGIALLLISHDLGVVAEMVDRIAVMDRGRIVEEGPIGEVIDRPEHQETRRLLAGFEVRKTGAGRG